MEQITIGLDLKTIATVSVYVVTVFLVFLRLTIRWTPKCQDTTSLAGKTVLITGATSGIGREVALECARRGAALVIGYRSIDKVRSLLAEIQQVTKGRDPDVLYLSLDLDEPSSLGTFINRVCQEVPALHVLVNNAAYQGPKRRNSKALDSVLMTNFLAHYALTRRLLDRKHVDTRDLRVINVTSGSYSQNKLHFDDMGCNTRPYHIYQAYGESKLALLMFSMSLPNKIASLCTGRDDVISIAVHPGAVNTELMRELSGLGGILLRLLAALCFRSVSQGAASIIYAIVADKTRQFQGQLLTDCQVKHFDHVNKNEKDFDKLWQYAEEQYLAMLPDLKGIGLTN